jgi:hypothetical protein
MKSKIEISGDGKAVTTLVEFVNGDLRKGLPCARFELRRDGEDVHAEITLRLDTSKYSMLELDLTKYTGPNVCDVGSENRTWKGMTNVEMVEAIAALRNDGAGSA